MNHGTAVTVVLVAATQLGVGCGDDADNRPTTEGVSASDDGRVDAVVVDSMPLRVGLSWWLLVDVADGSTVDGSSRLAVEVATVLWDCRGEIWDLYPGQLESGTHLSFEPDDTDARLPPSAANREEWMSAVAVLGSEPQVTCPPSRDELTATLAEQRAKWEAARMDDYEFTLFWLGFPSYGVGYRVTVVNSEPTDIRPIDGSVLDSSLLTELPGSIDEVFDRLEREVGADSVEARYDADVGFPVAVRIDRMINGIDDELEIRIYDLTIATT